MRVMQLVGVPTIISLAKLLNMVLELSRSDATHRAALLILPYAGVLIGLDVAAHYGSLTDAPLPVQFYLASDRSFGEFLEYALTAAVAVMTYLIWVRERAWIYLANALLFAWLTLDNWLEFHELFGTSVGSAFPQISWMPVEPAHLAEAALLCGVGLTWLVAMGMTLRAANSRALLFNIALAACVCGAAVFGVVVDLIVVY